MVTVYEVWLIFSLLGRRAEKDKNVTPLCTQDEIKQGGKLSWKTSLLGSPCFWEDHWTINCCIVWGLFLVTLGKLCRRLVLPEEGETWKLQLPRLSLDSQHVFCLSVCGFFSPSRAPAVWIDFYVSCILPRWCPISPGPRTHSGACPCSCCIQVPAPEDVHSMDHLHSSHLLMVPSLFLLSTSSPWTFT